MATNGHGTELMEIPFLSVRAGLNLAWNQKGLFSRSGWLDGESFEQPC